MALIRALAAAGFCLFCLPVTAASFEASFDSGTLIILVYGTKPLTVSANASGEVLVAGDDPQLGGLLASEVTRISVNGDAEANEVDLRTVDPAVFTVLYDTVISTREGNDILYGSPKRNVFTGGPGHDKITGDVQTDQFYWAIGDELDDINGGDGLGDSFYFTGTASPDRILVKEISGAYAFTVQGHVNNYALLGIENLVINCGDGDDTVVVNDLSAAPTVGTLAISGQDGDDEIDASAANRKIDFREILAKGNDTLIGSSSTSDKASFKVFTDDLVAFSLFRRDGKNVLVHTYEGARSTAQISGINNLEVVNFSPLACTFSVDDMTGSDFDTVTLGGVDQDDRFFLTASDSIVYTIQGGGPGDNDLLRVNTLGGTPTELVDEIQITGYNSILFTDIEMFEYSDRDFALGDRMSIE